MGDPYSQYTSYSTPTPGGVGYYPPEEQARQQQYPNQYQQQPYGADPNYAYPPPSPYHLAPESYQGAPDNRSYTPMGQPDHLGPVSGTGMPPGSSGKVPENLGY